MYIMTTPLVSIDHFHNIDTTTTVTLNVNHVKLAIKSKVIFTMNDEIHYMIIILSLLVLSQSVLHYCNATVTWMLSGFLFLSTNCGPLTHYIYT